MPPFTLKTHTIYLFYSIECDRNKKKLKKKRNKKMPRFCVNKPKPVRVNSISAATRHTRINEWMNECITTEDDCTNGIFPFLLYFSRWFISRHLFTYFYFFLFIMRFRSSSFFYYKWQAMLLSFPLVWWYMRIEIQTSRINYSINCDIFPLCVNLNRSL